MRAFRLTRAALAIEPNRNPAAAFLDAYALGAGFDLHTFIAQDLRHGVRHVGIFASDQARRFLDDGHLRAEAAVHLAELQSDVTATDDDQVLGYEIDIHDGRI